MDIGTMVFIFVEIDVFVSVLVYVFVGIFYLQPMLDVIER